MMANRFPLLKLPVRFRYFDARRSCEQSGEGLLNGARTDGRILIIQIRKTGKVRTHPIAGDQLIELSAR